MLGVSHQVPYGIPFDEVEKLFKNEPGYAGFRTVRRMCFVDFENERRCMSSRFCLPVCLLRPHPPCCSVVAATAAKIGMKCVVVQEKWVPHYDAVYDRVGNIQLTRLMGADSRLVDDGFDIGIRDSWQKAIQSVEEAGGKPYAIPAGASVHKYGALGYIGFAEEVIAQEKELGFKFDYIVVCVVTGSTQGGMIVGFANHDRADTVIGIDASGTVEQTREQVTSIVNNTAELVGLGREVREDEIVINPDYAYPAYGVPSEETNEAIRLAAKTEAMITDPVYEGKSMQGLIDLTKKGFFPAGSKVLYAHLGGAPALNGYSYHYKDG